MAAAQHDCRDHLTFHEAEGVETHGLDCGPYERWCEQWWECSICGERFTNAELEGIG